MTNFISRSDHLDKRKQGKADNNLSNKRQGKRRQATWTSTMRTTPGRLRKPPGSRPTRHGGSLPLMPRSELKLQRQAQSKEKWGRAVRTSE